MVSLKYSVAADKSTTQRKRKHEVSRSAEDFKLNNSEPAKSSSSSRRKFLLPDFEVPVEIRTTYIVWGYRYWRLSARECLQSLFHTTNETINVWSHAVAFVLFAVRFSTVFSWQDHDQVLNPLLAFAFSILLLMAASSTAHLFNCLSLRAHHIGFYFDYAAINCYAFGGAMLYFFYSRPLGEEAPLIFKSASGFSHHCSGALYSLHSRNVYLKTSMFRQVEVRYTNSSSGCELSIRYLAIHVPLAF